MSIAADRFDDITQAVNLQRKKGDALRRRHREPDAQEAYEIALSRLDAALTSELLVQLNPADVAELWGIRGGLLRRLGRVDEALASYRQGSAIEADTPLTATYNRSNAMKLGLIAGQDTLASLAGSLQALESAIEATIREDVRAASDAWTYADLGDTRLLLGRVTEAVDAYRAFTERARTDSPTTTLVVLREIATALAAHQDIEAPRLAADLSRVEGQLTR